jgi:hypothetical protein
VSWKQARQPAGDVIADKDILTYKSVPARLEPAHPLRRRRCQVCGDLIGGRDMRVVVIVPMTECTCPDQELHAIAYLACPHHDAPDDPKVALAAIEGRIYTPGRAT